MRKNGCRSLPILPPAPGVSLLESVRGGRSVSRIVTSAWTSPDFPAVPRKLTEPLSAAVERSHLLVSPTKGGYEFGARPFASSTPKYMSMGESTGLHSSQAQNCNLK